MWCHWKKGGKRMGEKILLLLGWFLIGLIVGAVVLSYSGKLEIERIKKKHSEELCMAGRAGVMYGITSVISDKKINVNKYYDHAFKELDKGYPWIGIFNTPMERRKEG